MAALFMNAEEMLEETEIFGKKKVRAPLCPPQIPHDLTPKPGSRRGKQATNRS
jgi:hypothetical protein